MLSSQAVEIGDSQRHVAVVPKFEMTASTSQTTSTGQTALRGPVTMATVQIPQMRVLQAIATKPAHFQTQLQVQQQLQPQQIQILKAVSSSRGTELVGSMFNVIFWIRSLIKTFSLVADRVDCWLLAGCCNITINTCSVY